jgi:microfibrillar-associated protein 1
MQPVKRKDAPRLARPAVRYWKGKAPKGIAEAQGSDSDSDNASQDVELADVPIGGLGADDNEDEGEGEEEEEEGEGEEGVLQRQKVQRTMNVAIRNVNISKEGKVIVDGKEESGRTIMEQGS